MIGMYCKDMFINGMYRVIVKQTLSLQDQLRLPQNITVVIDGT